MCIWSAWASLGYYQFECQCSSLKLDSGWFTPVACVIQDRGFLCGALSTIHRRTRTKSSEMFTSPKLLDISYLKCFHPQIFETFTSLKQKDVYNPETFSSLKFETFTSLKQKGVYIFKSIGHLHPQYVSSILHKGPSLYYVRTQGWVVPYFMQ